MVFNGDKPTAGRSGTSQNCLSVHWFNREKIKDCDSNSFT